MHFLVTYKTINNAKSEKDLLKLVSKIINIEEHSGLVEFLKENPSRFYVDTRSSIADRVKINKLHKIADRLVELRKSKLDM